MGGDADSVRCRKCKLSKVWCVEMECVSIQDCAADEANFAGPLVARKKDSYLCDSVS